MPFVDESNRLLRQRALVAQQEAANDYGQQIAESVQGYFGDRAALAEKKRQEAELLAREERAAARSKAKDELAFERQSKRDEEKRKFEIEKQDKLFKQQMGLERLRQSEKRGGQFGRPKAFEEAKQKELAKASSEFRTTGRSQLTKSIEDIDQAISILESGENITGPSKFFGVPLKYYPDILNQKGAQARDAIGRAIISTLKPTLGAQFTEKESAEIKRLEYNPDLDERENAKNAKKLREYRYRQLKMQDDLYDYVDRNGTDAGFNYKDYGYNPPPKPVTRQDVGRERQSGGQQPGANTVVAPPQQQPGYPPPPTPQQKYTPEVLQQKQNRLKSIDDEINILLRGG